MRWRRTPALSASAAGRRTGQARRSFASPCGSASACRSCRCRSPMPSPASRRSAGDARASAAAPFGVRPSPSPVSPWAASPSGTFATMMPMAKTRLTRVGQADESRRSTNTTRPIATASTAMTRLSAAISFCSGDGAIGRASASDGRSCRTRCACRSRTPAPCFAASSRDVPASSTFRLSQQVSLGADGRRPATPAALRR